MTRDQRSFRVALVEDRYLNPRPGELDAVPVLLECDWGVIQLPSERYTTETTALMLGQVAEQSEEFVRRGYDVVVIGDLGGLDAALRAAGVARPDGLSPSSAEELRAFLKRRPPPRAASSRTRTRSNRL